MGAAPPPPISLCPKPPQFVEQALDVLSATTVAGRIEFVREQALSGTIVVRAFRTLSAIDRHDLARIGSNLNQIARIWLSHNGHKLDRWADDYEVGQGVIRSPARRAKFHALDNGLPPPKRSSQKSREEWQATRRLHSERQQQRAEEIMADSAHGSSRRPGGK